MRSLSVSVFLVLGLLGLDSATAQGNGPHSPTLNWERMEARVRAMVSICGGQVMFDVDVKELVLAAQNSSSSAIGTMYETVPMEKGKSGCDSLSGSPGLPSVPLSAQGDADFQGTTIPAQPAVCDDAVRTP